MKNLNAETIHQEIVVREDREKESLRKRRSPGWKTFMILAAMVILVRQLSGYPSDSNGKLEPGLNAWAHQPMQAKELALGCLHIIVGPANVWLYPGR